MSSSSQLSPQEVAKALRSLSSDETKLLVFHLVVETHVLKNIYSSPTSRCCSIDAIQAWLDKDTEASWEKLVSALKLIDKHVLAREVATQHCPQSAGAASPSTDPDQPASVQSVTTPAPLAPADPSPPATGPASGSEQSPDPSTHTSSSPPAIPQDQPPPSSHQPPSATFWSLEKVKATIQELEAKFLDLNTEAEEEICEKEAQDEKFLRRFRKYLQLLPAAKKATHVKFFRECEREILEAKDAQAILAILCRYIDYRNHEILREIVVKFCGPPLQTSMQDYCKMLEVFETSTTVDVYISAVPDEVTEDQKKAFSEMVVKIDKPASQCTLHQVRKLNEAIVASSGLCPHSVYISGVANKCVEVVVRFPSSVAGWVLAALTPDFMTTHHLTEVALDGTPLTTVLAERDELNHRLIVASEAGDLVRVASLLNSGADVQTVNELLRTPLDWASWYGQLQVVRLLTGRGSEVDSRNTVRQSQDLMSWNM